MTKLLISYRREDSEGLTGRIYDRLVLRFGKETVFIDIDAIPLGIDFVEYLSEEVAKCDILLAVIGEHWLEICHKDGPHQGQRRLDDPDDFVRIEIQAALERKIPVIPVLIGKARMPTPEQLPPELKPLSRRNAAEVNSGRDFHNHVDRLIQGIERLLQTKRPDHPALVLGTEPISPSVPSSKEASVQLAPPQLASSCQPNVGDIITNSLGMKFAWIPPGTFLMGSPPTEEARKDRETQHKVTLTKGFYLSVCQVTQEQWQAITGINPSRFTNEKNLPVELVSWHDCQQFLWHLSEKEGQEYRIPTEAEWEYACRAGTTTPFYFGETISTDEANYNGTFPYGKGKKGVYRQRTTPVGSFPPNAWGLYDMHGNVYEWCNDWYGNYRTGEVVDPQGPLSGEYRVLRGGSFMNQARLVRSASRFRPIPSYHDYSIGFRPARVFTV